MLWNSDWRSKHELTEQNAQRGVGRVGGRNREDLKAKSLTNFLADATGWDLERGEMLVVV